LTAKARLGRTGKRGGKKETTKNKKQAGRKLQSLTYVRKNGGFVNSTGSGEDWVDA